MKTHYYLKYVNNPLTDLLAEAIVFRRIMALKGYPSPKEMQLKDLKMLLQVLLRAGQLDFYLEKKVSYLVQLLVRY